MNIRIASGYTTRIKIITPIAMNNTEEIKELRKKGELTIETLKTFEGFENISDEEAKEIIKSLEQFAYILYQLHQLAYQNKIKSWKQAA